MSAAGAAGQADVRGVRAHDTARRIPAWRAVLGAELRLVGGSIRRELLFAGTVVLLLGTLPMLIVHLRTPGRRSDMQFDELSLLAALLGVLAPLAVWKGEEPSRRQYSWALPVDRRRHALARLLAGLGWLLAATAVLVLWAALLARATDGEVSGGDTFVPLRPLPPDAPFRPEDHFRHPWPLPPWIWIAPFTAATVGYLVGSAVTLASGHPWRWYAGIAVAYLLLLAWGDGRAAEAAQLLLEGRYGLETLVTGGRPEAVTVTTPEGHAIEWLALRPRPGRWLAALALWGGAALVGAAAAAARHREG